MKLIKLASLALAVAGTLGVYKAGAEIIGVTTDSTKLNVAIIAVTNTPEKVSGSSSNKFTQTTKKVKFNNKQMLTIFQNWATASCLSFDFSGAKIVIGWDEPWFGDVLVVDKTGTNVLFDATTGATLCGGGGVESGTLGKFGSEAYFYVDFDDESGAYTEKYVDASPGSDTYLEHNTSDYELYDNDVFLPYTYLYSNGAGTVKFTQKWDKNGDFSAWNLSATGMFPLVGDQSFLGTDENASASAKIKSGGSGKGNNPYWYGED